MLTMRELQAAFDYFFCSLHAQHHIVPDSMPVTWRAYIDGRTAQMEEEIRNLKQKSLIGDMALKTTKERCDSLEKQVR